MIQIWNNDRKSVNKKSTELIDFCLKNSKYVVLTRRHEGKIPAAVLQDMEAKKLAEIERRCEMQVEYAGTKASEEELKRDGIKDRAELEQIFRRQAKQQMQEVRQMARDYAGEEDRLEEALMPYGLVKREYGFGGFFTWPDVWDICYFEKGCINLDELRKCFFGCPKDVGSYDFADLGFADSKGELWAKTTLHEGDLWMNLTEKQLEQFEQMQIPYHQL